MALSRAASFVNNVLVLVAVQSFVAGIAVVADDSPSAQQPHKNELYESAAITDDLFAEFRTMAAHLSRNYAKLMKRCRHNIMTNVRDYERLRFTDMDFQSFAQGVRAQLSDLFDVGRDLVVADRRRHNDFIMMSNVLLEQNVPQPLRIMEPVKTLLRRMRALRDGDENEDTDAVMDEYRQNCWRLIESVLSKAANIGPETRDDDDESATPLEDAVDALFEALLIVTNEEWARLDGSVAQLEADYRKMSLELGGAVEALQRKQVRAEDEL